MPNKDKFPPRRQTRVGSHDPNCVTCPAPLHVCNPDHRSAAHSKSHLCDSAFLAERGLFTASRELGYALEPEAAA